MAEYNKVYASLKPELPKVIQQEQIYVYAPKSSRAGMKSISSFNITAPVAYVQYDTTDGITVTGNSSLVSEEVSGEKVTQNFQSEFRVPIRPGKYINIDATADNDAVEVKVDDTALSLDYYKIKKGSTANVPAYSPTSGVIALPYSYQNSESSLVRRGIEGEAKFTYGIFGRWNDMDSGNIMYFSDVYAQIGNKKGVYLVGPTLIDTGTFDAVELEYLQTRPQYQIQYKKQIYYRMDPLNAPDGTLNYIHIDSIQNEQGGYKAIGKCFSITVSTKAWKVFDLEFGGSGSGNGLEQIIREASNTAQSVTYDSTSGATIEYANKVLIYKDSTTGETKTQTYPAQLSLPILPGKYISMDANSENDALEVKVDDIDLARDYIKINKTLASDSSPVIESGKTVWYPTTQFPQPQSFAWRNADGDCTFHKLNFEYIGFKNGGSEISYFSLFGNTVGSDYDIEKTPTDTGTLTTTELAVLQQTYQSKNLRIVYDNQVYYRMDPQTAPDGTLKYIHLDSIQNETGGYKATGKCFSVTVSTREWQVVDIDFGGSTRTTHNLTLTNSATDSTIYFSLTNDRPETYEGAPAGLWAALENSPIACTVSNAGAYSAGMITVDGDNFKVMYGNSEEVMMTQTQVGIVDSLV